MHCFRFGSDTIEAVAPTPSLERRPTMIYWITSDGTIFRAESQNSDLGGLADDAFSAPFISNTIVGRNLFHFIEGMDVCHLYQSLAARVLSTGHTISFAYRCDSPHIRREMIMQLSREAESIRYESSLVRETLRKHKIPEETQDASTFVAICSFCKNYRFPVASKVWKELEELLLETDLPDRFKFTHSVCNACYERAINS